MFFTLFRKSVFSKLRSCVIRSNYKCLKLKSTKVMSNSECGANNSLVWVDCEMSGLNYDEDTIMEIALILTDSNLNEIDSLEPMAIKTDEYRLNTMNEWCRTHHGNSGLTKACLESNLTIEAADDILYEFLCKKNIDEGVLAGNSIAVDRIFLQKWCPKFCSRLHYRLMDVSTVKELIKRWYPSETPFRKQSAHRALDDIRASIDELKYYKSKYFVPSTLSSSK
ncbi:ubiquitin specific protease-like protein 2 [Leptotrombidium deliense]|uniref:Ubiquitin specific protease-like protein 2 n=1 Tax=Leptotrombidium deliense TaxID=299467 RepID=A0A443SJF2_9ACAR|nr:ubiquitin specific protease-like protein 2 [Leptotrombidium deliense]